MFCAPRIQNLPKPKTKTDVFVSGDVPPYRATNSRPIERRPQIEGRSPYRGLSRTIYMLECPFCKNTSIILQEDYEKKRTGIIVNC